MILEALTNNVIGNLMDTAMIVAVITPLLWFAVQEWEIWKELNDEEG